MDDETYKDVVEFGYDDTGVNLLVLRRGDTHPLCQIDHGNDHTPKIEDPLDKLRHPRKLGKFRIFDDLPDLRDVYPVYTLVYLAVLLFEDTEIYQLKLICTYLKYVAF